MLNHISIWQMVIDVCLVTSILVMAFRFAKSSRAQALLPRIVELEGRISVLMAETEGRAKHVNDQLMRREQSLSRSIADAEKREKDIGLALNDGEALSKELALLSEGARREALELERAIAESRAIRDRELAGGASDRRRAESRLRELDTANESIHEEVDKNRVFSTRSESRRAAEWIEDVTARGEREDRPKEPKSGVRSLQESYRAAEHMLKSGSEAEEVSERTSLPIEGVQRLAQMIEIEREERGEEQSRYSSRKTSSDPRLGALGVSRRAAPTA
jgi:hypothetical protein